VDPTLRINETYESGLDDYGNAVYSAAIEDLCVYDGTEDPNYDDLATIGRYSGNYKSAMLYRIKSDAWSGMNLDAYVNNMRFGGASLHLEISALTSKIGVSVSPFRESWSNGRSQNVESMFMDYQFDADSNRTTVTSSSNYTAAINVTNAFEYWISHPNYRNFGMILYVDNTTLTGTYQNSFNIYQVEDSYASVYITLDYGELNGSFFINSCDSGKFLTGSVSTNVTQAVKQSATTFQGWTFIYQGNNNYRIALTANTNRLLCMSYDCTVGICEEDDFDSAYYTWYLNFDIDKVSIMNCATYEYLYSPLSGSSLSSSMDEDFAWWRVCRTSSYVELTGFNIADAVCRLGDSANYTISKNNNATWSNNTDFVLSSTVPLSVNYNTNTISYDTKGLYEVTATHKPSGKTATFDLVVYRPAVFLIHGRVDNSITLWGATNSVWVDPNNESDKANNHFNSYFTQTNDDITTAYDYTDVDTQMIKVFSYDGVTIPAIFNGSPTDESIDTPHREGWNLAYYMVTQLNGYTANVDMFVFNYPNQDAVVYNANKLNSYLTNLATHVRSIGTKEQKASLYGQVDGLTASTPLNIHIVAHSMGGLVARYYIENIGKDENVERLITIDTPHWGSGYADAASDSGFMHVLCDHDLDRNSKLYGGTASTSLNCEGFLSKCYEGEYTITDELNYLDERTTDYYAIAGIDLPSLDFDNDVSFEISTNYTTYDELEDAIDDEIINFSVNSHNLGDNIVGFLSQIGWTENDGTSPNKTIDFERIFVNVDTNAGNLEMISHLHSKMAHRDVVMEKVFEYLSN